MKIKLTYMLKKYLALYFFSTIPLAMFLFGCTHSPTGLENYKDPSKYTWTVDTLAGTFQTAMRSIWGSSPTNIYIVGHNDQPGPGTMFRFNGKTWNTTGFHVVEGGPVRGPVSLSCVYGFASNDVWSVGERIYDNRPGVPSFLDSSLIIHWNGMQWKEYKVSGRYLIAVGGSAPNDVWAVGVNTVFHFDGVSWQKMQVPIPPQGIQFHSVIGINQNDAYMIGYRNDVVQPADTNAYFLYHFDGTAWSVFDSVIQTPYSPIGKFGQELFSIKGILYSSFNGVYREENGVWVNVLDDGWAWFLGGNDINNIFAVGGLGTIYWYNGSTWKRISVPAIGDTPLYGVWTDGTEVFIVGNDGLKTYILHGK